MHDSWQRVARAAVVSGLVTGAATAATVAFRGSRDSASAVAPINATSHVAWGDDATQEENADVAQPALGAAIHTGAGVFWASVYEKLFGRHAERGDIAMAFVGGVTVAGLAYVTDYDLVPKRLTPGWEHRISGRSLALTYAVMAVSLPLRSLLHTQKRPPRARLGSAGSRPLRVERIDRTAR
jgi:hypothetical protein